MPLVMAHMVTLLGLLAEGRGLIPDPSAIAGVVSRVGSLERSVKFHEQTILELERQVSVVDSLVTKGGGDGPVACAARAPLTSSRASLAVA